MLMPSIAILRPLWFSLVCFEFSSSKIVITRVRNTLWHIFLHQEFFQLLELCLFSVLDWLQGWMLLVNRLACKTRFYFIVKVVIKRCCMDVRSKRHLTRSYVFIIWVWSLICFLTKSLLLSFINGKLFKVWTGCVLMQCPQFKFYLSNARLFLGLISFLFLLL